MGCMSNCMKGSCSTCNQKPENNDKWRYTIYTAILFLIVSCPYVYLLVNSILGGLVKVCDKRGCPTHAGILVHAVVFTLLLRYLMELNI